ncbi:MAG: hypothetical protein HXX08_11585 [Chloroflexi bacterium]|uniref:Uncharacterized protein n=1 Tax=Candidatus Chlorohelix allophototropha TaxID=3003348 RepID=A0A8T7M0Y4_9CHLR|nr:hypothetical protein [Chloroflexota bacterium]WJW65881.1 hypothetical protein OZ401_001660 [Chloroflexota bacterium L227-S17]
MIKVEFQTRITYMCFHVEGMDKEQVKRVVEEHIDESGGYAHLMLALKTDRGELPGWTIANEVNHPAPKYFVIEELNTVENTV